LQLFVYRARVCNLELLALNDLGQLAVYRVVLDGEEVLDKLLENFLEGNLVDLAVRTEPPNLNPNVFEHPLPVDHVLEFVLRFASLAVVFLGAIVFEVGRDLKVLRDQK
jgi:hypothetical protein